MTQREAADKSVRFFDCNAYLGLPLVRQHEPVFSTAEFVAAMAEAGVERALVWDIAQSRSYESPLPGNIMLAEEIAPYPNLLGCWAILPDADWDMPPPDEFLRRMKAARIAALRAFPESHAYFLDGTYCKAIMGAIVEHRIPLLLSVLRGASYGALYALLRQFPDLVCVLCDQHRYSTERHILPLMANFPNLHLDTTCIGMRGDLEKYVAEFGAHRVLFGSGFPGLSFKAMVHNIQHAELSDDDRAAIASGNLERILREAEL